jgi:hypothetical protein
MNILQKFKNKKKNMIKLIINKNKIRVNHVLLKEKALKII